MAQLIDDLLKYSRLGRDAVAIQPVDLNDVLTGVRYNLAARLAEPGCEFRIARPLPAVLGERGLLSQVLTNLFENALTYHAPERAPRVALDWTESEGHCVLGITDNGIGIAPEYHEKIFQVFLRLHRSSEFPGTGIGLAIVKKSVELLGGKVWLGSAPARGSTFYVRLALAGRPG